MNVKAKIQEAFLALEEGKVTIARTILENLVLMGEVKDPNPPLSVVYDHENDSVVKAMGIDVSKTNIAHILSTLTISYIINRQTRSQLVESIEKLDLPVAHKIFCAFEIGEHLADLSSKMGKLEDLIEKKTQVVGVKGDKTSRLAALKLVRDAIEEGATVTAVNAETGKSLTHDELMKELNKEEDGSQES